MPPLRGLARRNYWDLRLYEEIRNGSTTMVEPIEAKEKELIFPPAPPPPPPTPLRMPKVDKRKEISYGGGAMGTRVRCQAIR